MFDKKLAIYNGKIIAEEDLHISPLNRAFLYNDSVFESMFCTSENIPFFAEHINRITDALKVLEITVPNIFTEDIQNFETDLKKIISKNKIINSGRIRLTVFRTQGGLYTPLNNEAEYIVTTEKIKQTGFVLNDEGIRLTDFVKIKKEINPFSAFKSQNSIISILAGKFAKANQADESVIYNTENRICETASSNIFIKKSNKILTPELSEGCVNGIMRKFVIKTAIYEGFDVRETKIENKILQEAEEIFLTNAVSGIKWVLSYKDRRFYNRTAGLLLKKINSKYLNIN